MKPKTILFISKGEQSASTRYRALAYFDLLRSEGWEPKHITARESLLSKYLLLKHAREADAVVILRKIFDPSFFFFFRRNIKNLIFDFDDAIFCRSNGKPSKTRENRFQQVILRSRFVWAGNRFLAREAEKYNHAVRVIPTILDPWKYLVNREKPEEWFDLVWIGSSSTKKYLEDSLPLLAQASKKFSTLRLKIVADFKLPNPYIETVPVTWTEICEAAELASSHVGIAPMPDNQWTRGKCGLKVLQYMASGLPVITSPSGVNEEFVVNGINGFIADTAEEWTAAIGRLMTNQRLRESMGQTGRTRLFNNYTIAGAFKKILRDLNQLEFSSESSEAIDKERHPLSRS